VRDIRPGTELTEEVRIGEIGLIWWSYGVEATGKNMGSAGQGVAIAPRQTANETNPSRRHGESDMKNISLALFSSHRARVRA
jgi:hypothetical protein